jgi:K+-sensing histidine kinase KdpD
LDEMAHANVPGSSHEKRWQELLYGSIINRITRDLQTTDILLVANSD